MLEALKILISAVITMAICVPVGYLFDKWKKEMQAEEMDEEREGKYDE